MNIDFCMAGPRLRKLPGGQKAPLTMLVLMLCLMLHSGIAGAAAAMENYQFMPVPAVVDLGSSVKLTMAGCVDPAATAAAPTCPAPTVLADSVGAEAGTLRQTSPAEFLYSAPTVMPAHNMVEIHANYLHPSEHDVLGLVILIDPKLLDPKAAAGPRNGLPAGANKHVRYAGFVKVFAAPPGLEGNWQLNQFWLEGETDVRQTASKPGTDEYLYVSFNRLVANMSALRFDSERRAHYSEGREVFDGEFEVFAHLNINLTRHLYGWQAHGEKLGDRPPTSATYMDPGYNSSCGAPSFKAGHETTLTYKNLGMLSGTFDCAQSTEEGYGPGVVMSWYFVPLIR